MLPWDLHQRQGPSSTQSGALPNSNRFQVREHLYVTVFVAVAAKASTNPTVIALSGLPQQDHKEGKAKRGRCHL